MTWNQILKANKKTNWKELLNLIIFSNVLQKFTSCKHKVIRKTFPLANFFRTITVKQSIIFCFSLNLLWPSGYPKELKSLIQTASFHKFWLIISLCQNINFELHLLLFSVNYKVTCVSVALLPLWPAIYL